jgi:hypothetical protein
MRLRGLGHLHGFFALAIAMKREVRRRRRRIITTKRSETYMYVENMFRLLLNIKI